MENKRNANRGRAVLIKLRMDCPDHRKSVGYKENGSGSTEQ